MEDISNKTLAALLALTIVVSLGGTMISLSRLSGLSGVTGYDVLTDTANVSAYVSSNAAINFTTNATNFGTGTVHESCTSCTMNTSWTGGAVVQPVCCVDFTGADNGLVIENVGNRNVSLDISSNKDASTFIGGTDPSFKINVSEGELDSCVNSSGGALNSTYNNTWVEVIVSDQLRICDFFRFAEADDLLNISISVTIPEDSQTGSLDAIITATATAI